MLPRGGREKTVKSESQDEQEHELLKGSGTEVRVKTLDIPIVNGSLVTELTSI